MQDYEILEMTYFDLATIKRNTKVKNPTTGVTENIEIVVAENIKCSVSKKSTSDIKGEIGSVVSNFTLFINPIVDIKAGDSIEVTNNAGEKSIYLASKPFYYVSHREVPLTEKERL